MWIFPQEISDLLCFIRFLKVFGKLCVDLGSRVRVRRIRPAVRARPLRNVDFIKGLHCFPAYPQGLLRNIGFLYKGFATFAYDVFLLKSHARRVYSGESF